MMTATADKISPPLPYDFSHCRLQSQDSAELKATTENKWPLRGAVAWITRLALALFLGVVLACLAFGLTLFIAKGVGGHQDRVDGGSASPNRLQLLPHDIVSAASDQNDVPLGTGILSLRDLGRMHGKPLSAFRDAHGIAFELKGVPQLYLIDRVSVEDGQLYVLHLQRNSETAETKKQSQNKRLANRKQPPFLMWSRNEYSFIDEDGKSFALPKPCFLEELDASSGSKDQQAARIDARHGDA